MPKRRAPTNPDEVRRACAVCGAPVDRANLGWTDDLLPERYGLCGGCRKKVTRWTPSPSVGRDVEALSRLLEEYGRSAAGALAEALATLVAQRQAAEAIEKQAAVREIEIRAEAAFTERFGPITPEALADVVRQHVALAYLGFRENGVPWSTAAARAMKIQQLTRKFPPRFRAACDNSQLRTRTAVRTEASRMVSRMKAGAAAEYVWGVVAEALPEGSPAWVKARGALTRLLAHRGARRPRSR